MKKITDIKKYFPYILLHILLFVYSCCGIFSKTAAGKEFLSLEWCFNYGMVIVIMGVYALLWQQILKHIPLNIAFANKAVTIIWGMIWSALFFSESITVGKLIGATVVFAGVVITITGGEKKDG